MERHTEGNHGSTNLCSLAGPDTCNDRPIKRSLIWVMVALWCNAVHHRIATLSHNVGGQEIRGSTTAFGGHEEMSILR